MWYEVSSCKLSKLCKVCMTQVKRYLKKEHRINPICVNEFVKADKQNRDKKVRLKR